MNTTHSSTVVGEVLQIDGALNFVSMPRVLEETALYAAQENLPSCLAIDFANVTDIDSSAVASRSRAVGENVALCSLAAKSGVARPVVWGRRHDPLPFAAGHIRSMTGC